MERCASIIFYKDKKVLLQQRASSAKKFPDFWSFFGGKIEGEETPEQAIIRETKEELGYNLKKFKLFKVYNPKDHPHVAFSKELYIFIAPLESDIKDFKLMEGQDLKLFSFNEIEKIKIIPTDLPILKEVKESL
jgi:8-oxo-dGTP diphosphatase